MQEDINSLFNWCNLNGLHFHPSKCKAVSFGRHDSAKFFLGSDYLPFNNQIEDLGFIVSSTLSRKAHLDSNLLKCSRIFNFPKRNIPFSVSSHRKLLLYRCLILPILLYGALDWSQSLTMLQQLERFQYKVLRWIIRCSSYVLGIESLQLLLVCYSFIRDDIVFLWKLYNGAVDVQCNFHFTALPTRSSSNGLFRVSTARKVSSENNVFIRATRAANELIRLKIISFEIPLKTLKSSLINYLKSKTSNFYDMNCSCSHIVKCYCKFCRA